MIAGVAIKEITDIANDQGAIQHFVRSDEDIFSKFGEIYFSLVKPGVVKGWHVHDVQVSTLSCVAGEVLLVLHDMREGSETKGETKAIVFGDGKRKAVRIPAGVAYGWKNVSSADSLLANLASEPHDPERSRKIPLEEIQYAW